jgi:ubiquinone biosynthesis protein
LAASDIGAGLRLVAAGWILARHDALAPREVAGELPFPVRIIGAASRLFSGGAKGRPGERLAASFEAMGPVAIKLGQLLSTRADIFGAEFAADLGRLKDKLPPFPQAQAEAEVEKALGAPLSSLFTEFGPAVAAASLAQAHAAVLKDGRRVAVKVLRPRSEARVAAELRAMALGARIVEWGAPQLKRMEPRAFVASTARSMSLELDLRLEAAAASEMFEVMARDPYMTAPAVVWDGVAKRVLTLEWAEGTPLSQDGALDSLSTDGPAYDRKALADNLIRAFLAQALDHGVFHADLHEGNLFVSPPAKIAAVDFGIVGRLGPTEQRFMAEVLWGFLRRDYRRVAEVHFEVGYVPAVHNIDDFAQALRAVGEPIFGRPAGEVSMGRLLGQLFEITGLFDMKMRPELILLQKTMVTVEGVARKIDPDHDIWAAARPVVERWVARELSPAAKVRDLVKKGGQALDALARLGTVSEPATLLVETRRPGGRTALLFAIAALGLAASALAVALR